MKKSNKDSLFLIRNFDLFLIFIASLAVPFRMMWIAIDMLFVRNPKYWPPVYAQWLIGIGLATIIIHFLYLLLNTLNDKDNYFQSIFTKISYLIQARSAWGIGSSLACLLIGIYLLFPSDENLATRFQGALSIYFSAISTTLIVDIFYEKLAPITDVDKLLRSIILDLSICNENSNVWFVYPALNIGYYRALKKLDKDDEQDSPLPEDHIYSEFRKAFISKIVHLRKARAITYPVNLYHSFYYRYEEKHNTNINDKRVTACVNEAKILFDNSKLKTTEIQPVGFPQHIIIIGDWVYTIMSYGLPTYDAADGKFKGGENHLASLLVYRKKDPTLAKQISGHLEELCSPNTP